MTRQSLPARARAVASQLLGGTAPPTHSSPAAPVDRVLNAPTPTPGFDYHRARRFIRWYDGLLRVHDAAASAIAPSTPPKPGDNEDNELERAVISAHQLLLSHPVAARSAFAALVAEGERYSATEEGAALYRRLAESKRVQRANRVFRSVSMGLLDGESSTFLPAEYLDTLLRVADLRRIEPLFERVMDLLRGQRP